MIKRIICTILCLIVSVSLCGCSSFESIFSSYYEEEIEYIYTDKTDKTESTVSVEGSVIATDFSAEQGEHYTPINPTPITDKDNPIRSYKYLSAEQKSMYSYMLTAANTLQDGWFNIGKCSENYINNSSVAYYSLLADYPEFFWLSKDFVVSRDATNGDGYMALKYSADDHSCGYLVSKNDVENKKAQFDAKVNELLSAVRGLSEFETEIYFHDWLCENVVYDQYGDDNIYTAYGALINGVAVCEGYSRAMQYLCNKAGIPCALISGSSRGSGHMWNVIQLDGDWYHTDVTWDDAEDYTSHIFLNLNDKQIEADHHIFSVDTSASNDLTVEFGTFNTFLMKCTGEKYDYYEHFSQYFEGDFAAAAASIYTAAERGKKYAEFIVNNPSAFESDEDSIGKINEQLTFIPDCDVQIHSYSYENRILVVLF